MCNTRQTGSLPSVFTKALGKKAFLCSLQLGFAECTDQGNRQSFHVCRVLWPKHSANDPSVDRLLSIYGPSACQKVRTSEKNCLRTIRYTLSGTKVCWVLSVCTLQSLNLCRVPSCYGTQQMCCHRHLAVSLTFFFPRAIRALGKVFAECTI